MILLRMLLIVMRHYHNSIRLINVKPDSSLYEILTAKIVRVLGLSIDYLSGSISVANHVYVQEHNTYYTDLSSYISITKN
jgi:hypothetical protein